MTIPARLAHSSVLAPARHALRSLALTATLAGLCSPALAQNAGDITPPTREELTPGQPRISREAVTLTVDGQMERRPCALDNPEYAELKVTLNQVLYTGAERASEVALAQAHEGYLGRELPIRALCDIRDRAAALLDAAGYLAAVEIPAQNLGQGTAEMRVVLGRLVAVRARGDTEGSQRLLENYLGKLVGADVFNVADAERYLLLANDIPGTEIRLSLRPAEGGAPGDLIGEVAVMHVPLVADISVQNLGSRAVGRVNGLARVEAYGLTGAGDRTSLLFFSTADFKEQQTLQLAHAPGRSGLADLACQDTEVDCALAHLRQGRRDTFGNRGDALVGRGAHDVETVLQHQQKRFASLHVIDLAGQRLRGQQFCTFAKGKIAATQVGKVAGQRAILVFAKDAAQMTCDSLIVVDSLQRRTDLLVAGDLRGQQLSPLQERSEFLRQHRARRVVPDALEQVAERCIDTPVVIDQAGAFAAAAIVLMQAIDDGLAAARTDSEGCATTQQRLAAIANRQARLLEPIFDDTFHQADEATLASGVRQQFLQARPLAEPVDQQHRANSVGLQYRRGQVRHQFAADGAPYRQQAKRIAAGRLAVQFGINLGKVGEDGARNLWHRLGLKTQA